MITPWPQEYEQQSIRRTLCCARCNKALKKDETHVCNKCDLKMCMNNLVFHVTGKIWRAKMAKSPRRKCKVCNEWFHPAFSNQWWCSPEHGTELAIERRSKEREKAEKAADKKRRREYQQQKDKLKIRKLALKPRSYWIKQAQQAVNAYIRERDRDLPCISCGTFTSAQWDAGHYRTTAAAPQLRFDERNIHKQCVVCNQHKSGNLVPYRVMLIERIGHAAVDEIESDHKRHRWTTEECKAIKAEYQQKLKDLRESRSEAA